MFRKFDPLASQDRRISWWWFGIKIGVITALLIWWWLDQQNKRSQPVTGTGSLPKDYSIPLPDEASPSRLSQQPPSQPDDLRKIEGIGPKYQAILQAAGIQTYAQLAAAKPTALKQILVEAGLRLGDPATWPQQAALAAAADWDQLQELQSTLKAGRRMTD